MFHRDERKLMDIRFAVRAAVAAFFLFGTLTLFPPTLWAGAFQVSPVRIELTPQRLTDALQVRNDGSGPVVIQLQIVAWSQENGRDIYQPSDDLVATPPIFTIEPGATQIIRVGLLRSVDEQKELSYRLFLQEVPSRSKAEFRGLQVALRVGLPVFILPKVKAVPALSWQVTHDASGQMEVTLRNDGTAHVRIWDFTLYAPGNAQALAAQQVSAYLLPGHSRTWKLATDAAQPRPGDAIRIEANTDAGSVHTDIRLERP